MSEQLTKNFNSSEFACHCCGHVGDHDLHPLANALQALRGKIGKPIHLDCGYRCPNTQAVAASRIVNTCSARRRKR